jgi:iron complex outermembrane receptor protein
MREEKSVKNIKLNQRLAWMASGAMLCIAQPAVAQDAVGADSASDHSGDIIVTAQRREQRLIDVPSSVASVDSETIRNLSVQNVSDLATHVPNLQINSSTSLGSTIIIRGVGASSRNIGFDARVGVYLDGVYLGQSPALNQELVDLERVEVLRGPQGALFGKNTVAGAINLISRPPSFDTEAHVSVRIGNYDERQATARLNLPVSDTAAVSFSVNRSKRDGFTTNVFDDSTVGNRNVTSWRGQLRWDATPQFSVRLTADGLRAREIAEYGNAITDTFGTALSPLYEQPRKVDLDARNVDRRDVYGAALELSYAIDDGPTLRSITAWRSTKFASENDLDYSPADFLTVDFSDRYRQWTQEFQLLSGKGGPLDYVFGLYLYQQDARTARAARAGSLGPLLGVAPGAELPTTGELRTRNVALYGNAEYEIIDRLTLGLGFRWSWEEKRVDYSIDGSAFPLGLATGRFQDKRSDHDFSPTATLTYKLSPRLNAFVRYAQGYKSGGYNLDFVGAEIFPGSLEFAKESVSSFEGGLKGDLFDRSLRFSLTAFDTRFDDYQVDQFQDMGDGVTAIVIGNASKVRSRGVEFEASLRASDRLDFTLGAGYQDTIFTSFPGGGAGGGDASGKRMPGASKFQSQIGADYRLPLGSELQLALHADHTHRSAYYTDIGNDRTIVIGGVTIPYDRVPATDFVNARVALGRADRGWEVALWARNLFDAQAIFNYGKDFFGTRTRTYAPPRTWGLELSASF